MANNARQTGLGSAVDAVTLEILGNRLLSVAEEMGATLIKTAYSTNIKERKDCSTAVFDAEGNMIAQAEMIPMHLGSMLGIVEAVLQKYPVERLQPGDMFIGNDPYSGGGSHLPDITLAAPVFVEGQLVGFVANIAHHADVGGKVPGSTSGDANSIFQEGVRIPLVQVCRAGELIQDIVDFITLNSRIPLDREGDLAAQIAANRVGARRLSEVVARYGLDRYNAAVDALLDYAEAMMRAGIATLPDGVYSFTDYMDDDGVNLGVPVAIKATVTIAGDTATVDFTGSSKQVAGPVNVPLGGTLATVFYCFKALVGPSIPSNTGIYRALKVVAPEGTIVNCSTPAPVGARIDACQRVADVIFGAMFAAAPDRVIAGSNSSVTTATFSGTHPGNKSFYVYLETIAGGSGSFSSGDGLSAVQVHMTNTSNLPVEALEREYPLLVQRYGLRQDSGGAGRYRGGLGIVREIRALHEGVTFSGLGDRQRIAPWGLVGGHDGAPGRFYLERASGEVRELGSRESGVLLGPEDLIRVCTPGAGGYGSPLERDPQLVLRDLQEGKISERAVLEGYGVVLTANGEQVDQAATEQLRLSRS
ncbi:MAG: hydantoinase B/oxoprolinase family protein [Bacillota bacterium]